MGARKSIVHDPPFTHHEGLTANTLSPLCLPPPLLLSAAPTIPHPRSPHLHLPQPALSNSAPLRPGDSGGMSVLTPPLRSGPKLLICHLYQHNGHVAVSPSHPPPPAARRRSSIRERFSLQRETARAREEEKSKVDEKRGRERERDVKRGGQQAFFPPILLFLPSPPPPPPPP